MDDSTGTQSIFHRCHKALAEYAPRGRTALLPALQSTQNIYGYIPAPVATEVGRILNVPLADLSGVIDFYTMLYHQPVGEQVLRVRTDLACAAAKGERVLDNLCRQLTDSPGETSPDGAYTVERSPCLGLCDHAPAVLLGENPIGPVDPAQLEPVLAGKGVRAAGVVDGKSVS